MKYIFPVIAFWLTFLFFLGISSVAQGVNTEEVSQASPLASPEPASVLDVVQTVIGVDRKVRFVNLEGFTALEKQRLTHIASNVEKIVNGTEIEEKLGNHHVVPYTKQRVSFWDKTSPLNMSWREAWATTMRADWDMDYRGYRSWKSTVGFTYANVKWIKLNKSHSAFKHDHLVARNICHEFGAHKRGFGHAMNNDKFRPYSYPYALGEICADLYVKQFKPWRAQ
jgi:hypothetical protein